MKLPALGIAVLAAAGLLAQAPVAIDVASVRVHLPNSPERAGPPISGNRLTMGGNMKQLLIYAYGLKSFEITGGPSWVTDPSVDRDYFDVTAQAQGAEPLTQASARQLLQAVLADRFQLKAHRENKEMPVYSLVVAKGGLKVKAATSDSRCLMKASVTTATVASTFTSCQMDSLIRVLNGVADRPVLDRTGLSGSYDFKVEFARDPAAAADVSGAVSLFTAVQEQLGLKLDPQKGPVEVLVIDGVERPTDN